MKRVALHGESPQLFIRDAAGQDGSRDKLILEVFAPRLCGPWPLRDVPNMPGLIGEKFTALAARHPVPSHPRGAARI